MRDFSLLSHGIQEGDRAWNEKKQEIEAILKKLERLSQDPKPAAVSTLNSCGQLDGKDASVKAVDAAHRLIELCKESATSCRTGAAGGGARASSFKQQDEISEVMGQLNDELEGEERDVRSQHDDEDDDCQRGPPSV